MGAVQPWPHRPLSPARDTIRSTTLIRSVARKEPQWKSKPTGGSSCGPLWAPDPRWRFLRPREAASRRRLRGRLPCDRLPRPVGPAPLGVVRVGLVGMGDRGTYLLGILLSIEGVEIRAVCDLVESRVARAQQLVEQRHRARPEGYSHGDADYQRLCDRNDLDLVVNATPWTLHAAVCLAALAAGKHVATEVPAAVTVDQCWQLVEAAEKSGKHCMLLENFCYQRDVLMIWNLVRRGLFGEVMHAEGGYQKDARDVELHQSGDGSLAWQGEFHRRRKGNVFPTHDVGPISQWLDIHRGDRFDYLVSMGGGARGLNEYGAQYLGPDHPLTTTRFDMSDINLCLLRTVKGRTVYLISDTLLSRPQPRSLYRLMGTKGIYDRTLDKLYLEGKSPRRDRWHGDWEACQILPGLRPPPLA